MIKMEGSEIIARKFRFHGDDLLRFNSAVDMWFHYSALLFVPEYVSFNNKYNLCYLDFQLDTKLKLYE